MGTDPLLLLDTSAMSLPIGIVTVTGFPLLGKDIEMLAARRDPLENREAVLVEGPAEVGVDVDVVAFESVLAV